MTGTQTVNIGAHTGQHEVISQFIIPPGPIPEGITVDTTLFTADTTLITADNG